MKPTPSTRCTAFPMALLLLFCLFLPAGVEAATDLRAGATLQLQADEVAAESGGVRILTRDGLGAPIAFTTIHLYAPAGSNGDAPLRSGESNRFGFHEFDDVPEGSYTVQVRRIGYREARMDVDVHPGEWTTADFRLVPVVVEVDGLTADADRYRDRERFREDAGLTNRRLTRSALKSLPGLAEADPLRAIEVLPGVISTTDFSSAFNVRGGSADQNLILLDGTPIFNPFHLGGLFSVFNGDMIAGAELHTGGFPAEYGGRVSSVLHVESDPGGEGLQVDAGLSLLAARVALGGDVHRGLGRAMGFEKARWRTSARRSYFDWLLRPAFDFPYHLNDFQGVFEGLTGGGSRLRISGYTGSDVLDLRAAEDVPLDVFWEWGNDMVGARWTSPRDGGGTDELHVGYSRFSTGMHFPGFEDTRMNSGIERIGGGADLERRIGSRWTVGTGASAEHLDYDNTAISGGTDLSSGRGNGLLLAGYLQARWRSSAWLADVGVRGSLWQPDRGGSIIVPSPRMAVKRFFRDGDAAVKLSVGRLSQFLHSLRDEELPLGIDVWILSGEYAPHVTSDQAQLGFEVYPRENLLLSIEGFIRSFDGVVTTNPATNPNDPFDELLPGRGRSHGVDFLAQRVPPGDGTGGRSWTLAVSWLRAERTFPDFHSGMSSHADESYPPIFDRRLNLDLVLQQPLPGGIEGGLRWNFGTGLPYTRPLSGYHYFSPGQSEDGRQGIVLGPRNAARYPSYHRLDLSFRKELVRSWGRLTPYLDILNVYDRRNILFYFYSFDRDPPTRSGISMFPVLPTFGVEVSF